MWRLLGTLSVLIVSTSFIGAEQEVKCGDNFHEINGSLDVLTSINQRRCDDAISSEAACVKSCKKQLSIQIGNFSKILPTAFNTAADFVSVTFNYADELHCEPVKTPRELFNGLSSLERLALECVKFTSTENVPQTLKSLKQLNLTRTDFSQDTKGFLSNFSEISTLLLFKVPICVITPDAFPIKNISYLFLGANNLEEIKKDSFKQFHALKGLKIYENPLVHLEPGSFSGLAKLEWMQLMRNRITEIRNNTFSGLTSLKQVNLGENQISYIESGAFSHLPLQSLKLRNNQLMNLPNGVFDNLKDLSYLSLAGNHLSIVGRNVFEGLQLEILNLSCNAIHSIEKYAFQGVNLHKLKLQNASTVVEPNSISDGVGNSSRDRISLYCTNITKVDKDNWGLDNSVSVLLKPKQDCNLCHRSEINADTYQIGTGNDMQCEDQKTALTPTSEKETTTPSPTPKGQETISSPTPTGQETTSSTTPTGQETTLTPTSEKETTTLSPTPKGQETNSSSTPIGQETTSSPNPTGQETTPTPFTEYILGLYLLLLVLLLIFVLLLLFFLCHYLISLRRSGSLIVS